MKMTRLGRNTFLWLLLVSLLPLVTVTVVTYLYMQKEIRGKVLEDLGQDADRCHGQVHALLNAWLWRATDFSSDGFIRDASQEIILRGGHGDIGHRLNLHLRINKMGLHPDILEVFILDRHGVVVASSSEENVGKDRHEADYFLRPLLFFEETGGTFCGDLYTPQNPGFPELVFSHILREKEFQMPIGVIALRVRGEVLRDITHPYATRLTDGASRLAKLETYIVNKDGVMIANGSEMLRQKVDAHSVKEVLTLKRDLIGEYKNYRGDDVLGAALFIKETNWVVLAEKEAREVFGPLRRLTYIYGGIGGFSLMLIFGLSFTISGGMNKAIRNLMEGINRVITGDLSHRISLKRRDELQDLSDSFNLMTITLKTSNDERQRLFSVVERAKKEWEQTFDAISASIIIYDSNLRILRANSAAYRQFYVGPGVLVGKTCSEAFPSVRGFQHLLKQCSKGLVPVSSEVGNSKGEETFLVNVYPISKEGVFDGAVQIIYDITRQKKAEKELESRRITTAMKLAELADKRDAWTGAHLLRMREYCRILAEELRTWPKYSEIIDEAFIASLLEGSTLHDIGKVAVPDAILLKLGPLTPEEFELIKTHSTIGEEVLLGPEYFKTARELCRSHHERYDGKGYPDGLKGEDIPLGARILALVDTYDAITTERPYRKARSHREVCSIISNESGRQFDPDIVKAFLNKADKFLEIKERLG